MTNQFTPKKYIAIIAIGLGAMCAYSSSWSQQVPNSRQAVTDQALLNTLKNAKQELINLNNRLKTGEKLNKIEMNRIIEVANMRRDALEKLLQKHPEQVTQYLLPSSITESLPKQIQPYLETNTKQLTGTLEITAALYPAGQQPGEEIQYFLKDNNGTQHRLFFLGDNDNLKTGDKIVIQNATQISVGNGDYYLIVPSANIQIINHAFALPNTLGQQKVLAILVNFQDQPNNKPWTVAQAQDVWFSTTGSSVNTHYLEGSYRQTSVAGIVLGWYTLPLNSTVDCSTATKQIPILANAAATKAGIDISQYSRRAYMFPKIASCGWAGLGDVGGSPSKTWFNGYIELRETAHELGHNLGLSHANYLQCSGPRPTQGTCTTVAYGDGTDTMGGSTNVGHFNAFEKDRLGWLNYLSQPPIKTVTVSGDYVIDAYEHSLNIKALKILKKNNSNGSKDYYYLEYRQPIGFDSTLACNGCDYTKGVVIHTGNDKSGNTSLLLDMSPADHNNKTVALLPGNFYQDLTVPNGGVTIKVISVSCTNAKVTVTFGTPAQS